MSAQPDRATQSGSGTPVSRALSPEPAPPARLEALAVLKELVRLKDLKDRFGETADYRANKDRAWENARRLVG